MEWRRITCDERESLWRERGDRLRISATLTDIDGRYGDPQIFTQWEGADDVQVLQDRRFPQPSGERPDLRPCEHYVPEGA
jgi:hypothetical protein